MNDMHATAGVNSDVSDITHREGYPIGVYSALAANSMKTMGARHCCELWRESNKSCFAAAVLF